MAMVTKERKKRQRSPEQIARDEQLKAIKAKPKDKRTAQDIANLNAIKAAKFKELAEFRVDRALRVLTHIANLGNRANYVYTAEQVVKIVKALGDKVVSVGEAFKADKAKQSTFTL